MSLAGVVMSLLSLLTRFRTKNPDPLVVGYFDMIEERLREIAEGRLNARAIRSEARLALADLDEFRRYIES